MKLIVSARTKSRIKHPDRRYQTHIVSFAFLFATCLFSKTLLDLNIFLSTGRMVSTQDWVDLMFSQKEKMALAASPPNRQRILIVSGSNGLFGLSAKTISQATGLKTINLGSHAGLGGAYILSRSEQLIRKGDIILLPLEYDFYSSSGIVDDLKRGDILARFITSYDKKFINKIPITSIASFFFSNAFSGNGKKEYMSYFRGQLDKKDVLARLQQQRSTGGCYSGFTFNDYGDETCNVGYENTPVNPDVIKTAMPRMIAEIDPGGYIQRFVQFAKHKGAKIVPLYPVSTVTDDYQNLAFEKSAKKIKNYWEDMGIEFHDSLTESLLPPNLMFDGNYHPKDAGRAQRTKKVIAQIENQLNKLQE
jgi:hypothetical protein